MVSSGGPITEHKGRFPVQTGLLNGGHQCGAFKTVEYMGLTHVT